jgi:hypothetical protein
MGEIIVCIIFSILFIFNYVGYRRAEENKNYFKAGFSLIACIVCILVIFKMGLK